MGGRSGSIFALLLASLPVILGAAHTPNQSHLRALASDFSSAQPSRQSLCGEDLDKETGTLNGLYYVFYQASVEDADKQTAQDTNESIPVILWLSGGPGCSGVIALLFENGPCMFDDETRNVSINPYAWTSLAYVIYIDQPLGTGFSDDHLELMAAWTEGKATRDLELFLKLFFAGHPELIDNDFYVFGESFAGHYVPDLAAKLLDEGADPRWSRTLKGIGIGNGVVSSTAVADAFIPFATTNSYGKDLLGQFKAEIKAAHTTFSASMTECQRQLLLVADADHDLKGRASIQIPDDCVTAADDYERLRNWASMAVTSQGWNVYDMRLPCRDDPLGLCYRFSRVEEFVNSDSALEYFGESDQQWDLCAMNAGDGLDAVDAIAESESNVAFVLERGVRVLVYGGDADTVVNWQSQDKWTRSLQWTHRDEFQDAPLSAYRVENRSVGQVRSSHGLTFYKIFEAGHVRVVL